MFKAILITKEDGTYAAKHTTLEDHDLPEGDVTVDVEWSTLNFKDGLALTGRSPVVRRFPMVPGIDFAGTVRASSHADFKAGDEVVYTGFGLGETQWGGYSQRVRVSGDRTLHLPEGMSPRDAMAIGTAGFTAMLCVLALERHDVSPESGEILISGASGGVGSIAVHLLANRGYKVLASTGKSEEHSYLQDLGAAEIIDRQELSAPGKPLAKERWAGAVDVVGGMTLANICAGTRYGGTVAACGLAESMDFPASVAPFILRGISLVGIDSGFCPMPLRKKAWEALRRELDPGVLARMVQQVSLDEVTEVAPEILAGKIRGRIVVAIS